MNPKSSQPSPDPLSTLVRGAIFAVVFVAVGACLAVLAYIFMFNRNGWSADPAAWGEFGDFFGGLINPIVGIVTVFLVLLSITIQRKELQASLRELKQSNEALAAQNAAIALQSFEQTFFAWLMNYRDLVSSVTDQTQTGRHATGRDALLLMWAEFLARDPVRDRLRAVLTSPEYEEAIKTGVIPATKHSEVFKAVLRNWQVVYNQGNHHIDSMFRTLYRLVRWVDEHTQLSPAQKSHYIGIVQAQLSQAEMLFLFYNGFTDHGRRFAEYINKYAMFGDLDDSNEFAVEFMRQLDLSPFRAEAFTSVHSLKS